MQNSKANKTQQNFTADKDSSVYKLGSIAEQSWQQQLANTVNNIQELSNYLHLDLSGYDLNPKFPLRVPKYYLDKITKSNIKDPLLLQILPQLITPNKHSEKLTELTELIDPLDEKKFIKTPGLIHKYYNRVLLTLTSACGIHCRYCFRQNFPYNNNVISNKSRQLQIQYLQAHPEINEVILSGGDPLCVNNKFLEELISQINNITHIKTLRIHSRMPLVIPDRVDYDFINILNKYNNLNYVLVTHCNHPNELDSHIQSKMLLLKQNQVTLLNQTVLLKDVNNNTETLVSLSHKLFACHIMPYYLHMLDPVIGSSYFNVDIDTAKQLISAVQARLSGYLVPKLVKEIPGQPNKTLIA